MELDILFLDIDGVLNPYASKHPHVFSPDCVAQLKRLFGAHPKLKIVFSTAWRVGTPFFVLGWLWRQHELPLPAVIGRTTDIAPAERGREIRKWLEDAPRVFPGCQVRRYAALDDEVEPIREQLPRGTVFACEPGQGLTRETTDRLIRYFGD